MSSAFKVLTQVTTEPIALADAKSYLRVDFTDDDTLISGLISRARSYAETVTHRAMATQQIQTIYTIERPTGGELSGSIEPGPNWYEYQEQLGANPFGAAQFYFDLPMPPVQPNQTLTVETKVTAFDAWTTFTGNTYLDNVQEPARMYFQVPVTANFWRFTYWAGYDAVQSYPITPDLLQPMYEAIAYWYQFREAQDLPQALVNKFLSKRVDWI